MRSVHWNEPGAAPALRDDLPAPRPGVGEVLVRVHASSVNPVDNALAAGMLKDMETWSRTISPVTLGRDFAGTVEQVGDTVTGVSAGDEVFGFVPIGATVHAGSWAVLIVVPEPGLTRKPDGVDKATAGAAPLAATQLQTRHAELEARPRRHGHSQYQPKESHP
jgi:NADPH:quinone reductase